MVHTMGRHSSFGGYGLFGIPAVNMFTELGLNPIHLVDLATKRSRKLTLGW